MKILQIGAGSMGTRRLRDLHKRPGLALGLYDDREDRRLRAKERFGVAVFSDFPAALAWEPDALVISTPPGTKRDYLRLATERGLHHFSEADIWTYGMAAFEQTPRAKKIVCAPSASFAFLPLVRALGPLVRDRLGSLLSYQFFMATYMPGWHPGEGKEYYARHRDTAPAREMIPFELHWLNALFGPATAVAGSFGKHGALPGNTEDTWSLSMRLKSGGIGQMAITMACPSDYRRGACFGTNGMISWDIYGGDVTVQTSGEAPSRQNFGAMRDVLEAAYSDEINTFIDALTGAKIWPQSYALSQQSSATLAAAEKSSVSGRWVTIDPDCEPALSPPLDHRATSRSAIHV